MSTVRIASPIIYRVNSRKNVRERSGRQLTRNIRVAAAFLDHQGLSPLCNLVQLFLANTPLGYNNILGGEGSRGAPEDVGPIRGVFLGSSGPAPHMLTATVSSSLRE